MSVHGVYCCCCVALPFSASLKVIVHGIHTYNKLFTSQQPLNVP